MAKCTGITLARQSGSNDTAYLTWNFSKDHVKNYIVQWYYTTGDGVAFVGASDTTTSRQSTYNFPNNALAVKAKVRPVATTRKVNGKDTPYWSSEWSAVKTLNVASANITTPSEPDITMSSGPSLRAYVDGMYGIETMVCFELYYYDSKSSSWVYKTKAGAKVNSRGEASNKFEVEAGKKYRVRARGYRGTYATTSAKGTWSPWSDPEEAITKPAATKFVASGCRALSATSIRLEWEASDMADEYEVEYTTDYNFFTSSPGNVDTVTVSSKHTEITGLDTGIPWYYRVRASNDEGKSAWAGGTKNDYILIGAAPAAPTTWSDSSTVITGTNAKVYGVHNTEDGSAMTQAEVQYRINGGSLTTITVSTATDEGLFQASIPTSGLNDQSVVRWRARTAGVTGSFSSWSTTREITIYEQPTITVAVEDYAGTVTDTITGFPITITGVPLPASQNALSYNVELIAASTYDAIDNKGDNIEIFEGNVVYSRFVTAFGEDLDLTISAGDAYLANNASYTLSVTVSMDSGLTATFTDDYVVAFAEDELEPDAQMMYFSGSYSMALSPFCVDDNEGLISGVLLGIYRAEPDGSLTEIATGIENTGDEWVMDPHPSLDYARYRITATSSVTGLVSVADLAPEPIQEKAIILQWDETWREFEIPEGSEDELDEDIYTGAMVRLPYNINTSESYTTDAEMVEYIGRQYPVAYYGTHKSTTASWSFDVLKSDADTIYRLRRLAAYMGDVYVREPSGTGYLAHVTVGMNFRTNELTVPVSLSITRVEG